MTHETSETPKPLYGGDTLDQKVTYEEIRDIIARRHDMEVTGDNDIM